jgi:hypothetical protein
LLSEQRVFGEQLGARAEYIPGETGRGGGGAEYSPYDCVQAASGGLEHGDQRGEHGPISLGGTAKNKTGSTAAGSVPFGQVDGR